MDSDIEKKARILAEFNRKSDAQFDTLFDDEKKEEKQDDSPKDTMIPDEIIEGGGLPEGEFSGVEKGGLPVAVEKPENSEKLEGLKKELEEARADFARKDYEVTTAMDRLRGFFGKNLKTDSRKITDTEELYSAYKNKSDALLEFQLEDIKKRMADVGDDEMKKAEIDKEIKTLIRYFRVDEASVLAEARTNARAEARKDKSGEKALEWSAKLINEWRKFDWQGKNDFIDKNIENKIARTAFKAALSPKMAISAALFVSGAALPAKIVYRILGAAAAGTGVSLALENFSRKIEEKKSEEFAENLMKSSETSEDKFQDIMDKLKKIDYRESLRIEQNKSTRRIVAGFAVSGALGAWGASKLFGNIEGMKPYDMDIKAYVDRTLKYEISKNPALHDLDNQPPSVLKDAALGKTPDVISGTEEITQKAAEKTAGKAVETIIEIKKGSSLEGGIMKYLDNDPKLIEKYNELNGGKGFSSGQIAHRMALAYAENNPEEFPQGPPSLIHEGAGIKINPETMEIEDISNDDKSGYLREKTGIKPNTPEDVSYLEEKMKEFRSKTGTPVEDRMGTSAENGASADNIANKEFSDVDQASRSRIIEEIQDKADQIKEIEDQPMSRYSDGNPSKYYGDVDRLKGDQKELWDKLLQEDSVPAVASDIKKTIAISNPENWRQVKSLTFDQIRDAKVGDDVKNNIVKVYRTYRTMFGKESVPRAGETVAKWTERLARMFVKAKSEII